MHFEHLFILALLPVYWITYRRMIAFLTPANPSRSWLSCAAGWGLPAFVPAFSAVLITAGMVRGVPESVATGVVLCLVHIGMSYWAVRFTACHTDFPHQSLNAQISMLDAPMLAFHFSDAGLKTPSHVEMWADALDATGVSWFAICREAHHHEYLVKSGKVRSVLAESREALLAAVPESVSVMVYANNGQKNRQAIEMFPNMKHVQMLHGDSDKPPSYSPLTRNYSDVFVSGQMGQDRYRIYGVHIPDHKFTHVGRPQLFRMDRRKRGTVKTIVYMPTWAGVFGDAQFSSLDQAERVIRMIGKTMPGVQILFKPHPLNYMHPEWAVIEKRIKSALKKVKGVFAQDALTAFEAYDAADILVTDISSTMIDFLYTGRPQIVLLPDRFQATDRLLSLPAAYQVKYDLSNLVANLNDASSNDSLAIQRESMRKYTFGNGDGASDLRFKKAIMGLTGSGFKSVEIPRMVDWLEIERLSDRIGRQI